MKGYEDIKLIGLWTAEPGNLYTRDPIRSYDDIKGMKIRAAGRLEGDFLKRLNAVPESMHPADAVEALRRGTIDGTIQGWVLGQHLSELPPCQLCYHIAAKCCRVRHYDEQGRLE